MKLKRSANVQGKKQEPVNLTVEVQGFEKDENGKMFVKGLNLSNGKEVRVCLTDQGASANNPNRNSLERLSEGFKIKRDHYKLTEGGIVSFRTAYTKDNKNFLAQWPNVLAYNAADAQKYVGHSMLATLDLNQSESGQYYGTLYCFKTDENDRIVNNIDQTEEMKNEIKQAAEETQIPAFLVRFINENNEVENYNFLRRKAHRDTGKYFQPQDYADYIASYVDNVKEQADKKYKVDIVPAERYIASKHGLNPENGGTSSALKAFQNAYRGLTKELENGDIENVAKEVAFQTGGDNGIYVNAVHVAKPYSEGEDPVLIGGYAYYPDLLETAEEEQQTGPQEQDQEEVQMQEQKKNEANNQQSDKSDNPEQEGFFEDVDKELEKSFAP